MRYVFYKVCKILLLILKINKAAEIADLLQHLRCNFILQVYIIYSSYYLDFEISVSASDASVSNL